MWLHVGGKGGGTEGTSRDRNRREGERVFAGVLFHETVNLSIRAPPLRLCLALIPSTKSLSPNTSRVTLALRLQHVNFGGTRAFNPQHCQSARRGCAVGTLSSSE